MFKFKRLTLVLGILIFGVTLSACNNKEQDLYEKIIEEGKIVVGTEGTYAPFTYHDAETGDLTGFDVEIAREVAERLGVEVEFLETKWDGLLAGVNTGRYDIVANQVWKKPAREEAYTLTDPYMLTNAVLVVQEGNTTITSLEDIAGQKGAHSLTSAYADMAREKGAEIVGVDTFTEAVQNLINGHVEYTINDTATVAYYLAQNPDANVKALNLELDQFEVVFALPKENANTLEEKINAILEDMRNDGTYDAIYQTYFEVIE
ncbi:transporter substrate-binding domain-containing protein [Haloplasma contractile]|uniref:Periplasmic amino acid binding protein n=1 Tax=Haloplasma contractile SSD-17B TaxID=1033810 RepID=U2FIU6_9MOLU|nr:transporter substrate-binding domain-containing protein [Haloplasma contractile]ERJ11179.1 Periplasmic amino acid binding protein [Haloplasma contractile SSD-17B]